ncbi:M56 family metallopeptidase [Caldanaerobius fijiensis]|uniref:M56 family metallopeptidase n=1 Tax=Caldanaerobius fijiensis TaxID=456330 RepID=UPI000932657C|nr:M56 family metallopeptidase [Caldanaerobius fijiensis]
MQIIRWFNPLLWYFFKRIRQDMEVAADRKVLNILGGGEEKEYGRTIITMLESLNSRHISLKLVGMVDNEGQY